MFGWSRKRATPAPLTGAPAVRRQKTYSAATGYVYEYFYAGHRDAGGGIEYVFQVTADRKTFFPVSVLVAADAFSAWNQSHGRALTGTEQYAVAKMALFQAFDERLTPDGMRSDIRIGVADAAAILDTLGID